MQEVQRLEAQVATLEATKVKNSKFKDVETSTNEDPLLQTEQFTLFIKDANKKPMNLDVWA
jgi:hypothetical protein